MSSRRVISKTLNVNTIEDGEMYYVEWKDANGVIPTIPCYENGQAKDAYGGADEWIRATLYKKEGDGAATPITCYHISLKAYNSSGTQITGSGWPKDAYNTSYITLNGYEGAESTHVKYVVTFEDLNHNMLGNYSIDRTLDGVGSPEYNKEYYAWSNQTSTAGVGVAPTIEGSWSNSIPQNHTYAYLWKKIVHYTLNIYTRTFTAGTPQYYRMNGENGTSIRTKGSVKAVVDYRVQDEQHLPSSGVSNGALAWVEGDNEMKSYNYINQEWVRAFAMNQDELYIFKGDREVYEFDGFDTMDNYSQASDGDSYTNQVDNHLWQWSMEANKWLDLGQFKGDAGVTYYTHIAWANSVIFKTPTEPVQGCLNKPNASLVIGGSITPPTSASTSKPYMGIRIDTIAGYDSTDYTSYTWERVQGEKGDRGKTGKFYYYGGVFDINDTTTTFIVNDANTPYFMYTSGTTTHYWVYVKEVEEGYYTMPQLGEPSSSNADWKIMTDDFKYIISEAVFASFAHLGGFIMSDPWMISQSPTSDSPSQNISDFHGDPLNDDFRPMFAVNGQTGECFMQNATISGNLKTGSFGFLQTSNMGIRTKVYSIGQKGFVLREDGSATFNLPYLDDEGEVTNGYAIACYGGANFVGNGKNIVLASQQVSGRPKTFVIINGATKIVLDNIPRSLSGTTAVGEIYVDADGYVKVKTS